MAPKPCIYKCGTILDGWDDEARKYKEAGTGGLHTKERCQEAKAKGSLKDVQVPWGSGKVLGAIEEKNDHGNEDIFATKPVITKGIDFQKLMQKADPHPDYVDHTLKPELVLKTLTDPTPEGIDLKYNNFAKEHKIRYSQSHVLGSQYTVYVWYEEK